jgi:hypothetical protein
MELWKTRNLSAKSLAASEDRDYEAEQAQIQLEAKQEIEAPISLAVPAPPGPEPGLKADQMAEKGVLAGEPRETPES